MKKIKRIKVINFVFLLSIAIFSIYILYFFSNTYSGKDMALHCKENSNLEVSEFTRYETTSLQNYAFWVANSKSDLLQQEMFIFREKLLFNLFDVDRYTYSQQIVGNSGEIVSSVLFMPRDLYGRKSRTNTIIFFSSNPQKINNYVLNFQENTALCTMNKKITQGKPFVVEFTGVGINNNVTRDFIDITFYDESNNIVEKRTK